MVNILGYGEDSLTLWALSNKLELFLKKINDNSDVSNYTIFYRPSFGHGRQLKEPTDTKAEFGEFDASFKPKKPPHCPICRQNPLVKNYVITRIKKSRRKNYVPMALRVKIRG